VTASGRKKPGADSKGIQDLGISSQASNAIPLEWYFASIYSYPFKIKYSTLEKIV